MTADWLEILREAVAERGQKPVADALGYSRSTVSPGTGREICWQNRRR
ncbi:hypothetical protein [Paludibacterium denitrificans]|uniref:Uncharacterized protein n=1 Tax=Paludibacterium denitrificans TaxID=2675226 RepID=A0A844GF82_9NEIS|nr:hypothetical protein [Paludibacterium denitrificans]MTD33980.1 hypothetical protein [Paludibacterium denitrificans]